MAHKLPAGVLETTTTTGTGTLTLAGAVSGFRTFADVGDGNTTEYFIRAVNSSGVPTGDYEIGIGTYTASGTTLARTTVVKSSNGNNAVNFSVGTKRVGVSPVTESFEGYTSSGRVVIANGASLTVTHEADPNDTRLATFLEYVATAATVQRLALNFNGANNATSATDDSGFAHSVVFTGTAKLTTAVAKHGSASLTTSGGTVTLPSTVMNHGTSDFTIHFWIYIPVLGTNRMIFDPRTGEPSVAGLLILRADNTLCWYVNGVDRIISAAITTTNTWMHVAVCRASGTTRLFVDGSQVGSSYTDANTYVSGTLTLGEGTLGAGLNFTGNIDSFEVRRDALYTGTFTPPAAEISADYATCVRKPRAESVVTVVSGDGAGGSLSTQTTFTNASGASLQGEAIVVTSRKRNA